MAGLLFAVHPLHVEAVSWPAASSDLLATTSCLLSLLLLEAYVERQPGGGRNGLLGVALVSFLLGLLSKESAAGLPAVVLLRLLLHPDSVRRRAAPLIAGAYAGVLACYLGWRFSVLGGVGGYEFTLGFWNTVFPSAPLLMALEFVFPANRMLFSEALGPWLGVAVLVLMAAVALWLLQGLERIPSRRLWFWVGSLFIMSVPVWVLRDRSSAWLEGGRFAYLPTIGLAWLFGDVCGGRGLRGRGNPAIALGILAGAVGLTLWYVGPWREAGRVASRVVAAGATAVAEVAQQSDDAALYVRNLPEFHRGVPVFANAYAQAIHLATGSHMPVRVVSDRPRSGSVHPDVMAASKLRAADWVVAWDAESGEMDVLHRGQSQVGCGPSGGRP
jgi:hypothetical protein